MVFIHKMNDRMFGVECKKHSIALVASEKYKSAMLLWALKNTNTLSKHLLHTTHNTGLLLNELTGINIKLYLSGLVGGYQQIGSKIATGDIDILFAFWETDCSIANNSDMQALIRLANHCEIPIACNVSTANYVINVY